MLQSHVFIRHVWTTRTHAHITYMHALTLHMQTHGKHINAHIQTAHTHITPHTHTHYTHTSHTHTLHTHIPHTHIPHTHITHTHPTHTHTQIIQSSLEEIQNAVNQSVWCVLEIEQNIPSGLLSLLPLLSLCGVSHFYFLSPRPGVEHHTVSVRKTVHFYL